MSLSRAAFDRWADREVPDGWMRIRTIDAHAAGEPLRVIVDGFPEPRGTTILERRRFARRELDNLRTALMFEPRGHADMYGAIITEPATGDGDFGTFFLHNEGYSTMCGHAIIALVTLVLDSGMLKKEGLEPLVKIDAPPGRVTAVGHRDGKTGRVERVSFRNVPSFLALRDQVAEVPGIGKVTFDLAYGGAFYAYVDARPLGLPLDAANYNRIIECGKAIKRAVMSQFPVRHPFEDDLSFLYGTIFIGDPDDPAHHSRNVCIFAEGEVDRSATGTGVSARMAVHCARGDAAIGDTLIIESIIGSRFSVRALEPTTAGPHAAIIPEVAGQARITGRHEFLIDPDDPLQHGFLIR
jgi:proline racemase